jgi:phage repressor protein C with HTH and peptisase S24 domain
MTATEWRVRLRATGRSETDLAKKVNKSKSALSRIMTGERQDIRQSEVEAIEAALAEFEGRPQRPQGLIPLLGYAAGGGTDRVAWSFDRPMDWVEAPPMRDSATEIIAIRVVGDSMEPRLFSGETIYVGLNISPARGGDAVFEFRDGTAVVKSYQGSRQGHVFAHQYNPDEELRFDAAGVAGLHAVLWRR